MIRRVFVTGAGGFFGGHLVAWLREAGYAVRGLVRSGAGARAVDVRSWEPGQVENVLGDLLDPESYGEALRGCDAVLHLAAITGKATGSELHEVNVEGTRRLLAGCRAAGVERFLFISSIAVNFPTDLKYEYARSKAAAEERVQDGGVSYCILRPAIVVGAGSPILDRLRSLAGLPVIPLLAGGQARIQPIWVGDLCGFVGEVLRRDLFAGDTLELGGPEVLSIGEFVREIRRLQGGGPARVLRLPAGPVVAALSAIEAVAAPLLPINTGQLASFLYDGTIEGNELHDQLRARLKGVSAMLEASGIQ